MKNIILLSDGTGNSAAALAKTNVWRMYRALDLARDAQGGVEQVAFYDNGVGTSSFKPLAILGGAFGWGLKRNILDLYRFLCLTYEPGDRIYAFGFSRGAFTIRTLITLVISQGLIRFTTEAEFRRASRDAYRHYRRGLENTTGSFVVQAMRYLRDGVIRAWRRVRSQHVDNRVMITQPDETPIQFIGVWDTVAAYGTPVAELTTGIDQVVWPLSMPNYNLHPNVRIARHALALDDERYAFHPLLWDEVHERTLIQNGTVSADRLRQVWFAGMHADVGGGYADDGPAMVPLLWMIREAAAADLRFVPDELARYTAMLDASAPLNDSRRGLGGYYRYQPRRIDAWLEQETIASLALRNPLAHQQALLTSVRVHHSAIERIEDGTNRYAPIVLPPGFVVEGPDGQIAPSTSPVQARFAAIPANERENIWNDVFRKRVNYFLLVIATAILAAAPLYSSAYEDPRPENTLDFLAPVIRAAGGFLPAFLGPWIEAFARGPDLSVPVGLIIVGLIARGAALQAHIQDHMRWIWAGTTPASTATRRMTTRMTDILVGYLRTREWFQRLLRTLKWRLLPLTLGYLLLALIVVVPVLGWYQARLVSAEASGKIIDIRPALPANLGPKEFSTKDPYWDAGVIVQTGRRYRVTMTVQKDWKDSSIDASPDGFWTSKLPFWLRWAILLRRSNEGRWFQPFVTIIPSDGHPRVSLPLTMRHIGTSYGKVFEGTFEAPHTGSVRLWVNDAAIGFTGLTGYFYNNNEGTAVVEFAEDIWSTR